MLNVPLIGDYIKTLRTRDGLSQEAVGKRLGVSRVAVTKWESGDTKNLKLANLAGLSALFHVSLEELVSGGVIPGQFRLPDAAATEYPKNGNGNGALLAYDFGRRKFATTTIEKTVDVMVRLDAETQARVYGYACGLSDVHTTPTQTNKAQ